MAHRTLTAALAETIRKSDSIVVGVNDRITRLAMADVTYQLDEERLRKMPRRQAQALLADVDLVLDAIKAAVLAHRAVALARGAYHRRK